MRILIIGGSGFIGQNLIEGLLAYSHKIICFDRFKPSCLSEEKFTFIEGDFSATHLISEVVKECDIVFHLACSTLPKTSNDDPDFDVTSNVLGTIRILEEIKQSRIKKFIFASSGGTIYGIPSIIPTPETHPTNPLCSYGITKLMIEKYLNLYSELYGINTCSLRFSNLYGKFQRFDSIQGAIAVFCYNALTDQPIKIWGNGSTRRDFIYIGDIIDALTRVIDMPITNGEINIGSGNAISLNEIIEIIEQILNKKIKRIHNQSRKIDVPLSMLDISKANSLLNWQPKTNIYDGIKSTLEWIKQYIDIKSK